MEHKGRKLPLDSFFIDSIKEKLSQFMREFFNWIICSDAPTSLNKGV